VTETLPPMETQLASACPLVAVLNHSGADLSGLEAALLRGGFQVQQSTSLAASLRLLQRSRPEVVLLSPLALVAGGLEIEQLEALQQPNDPVPVIFLLDGPRSLKVATSARLVLRDFLFQPWDPAEAVQRIELAVQHRRRLRDLQARTQRLEGQVSMDFKTGLMSELYFGRVFTMEFKRAQRHHNTLSLLLVDVDNFKGVNDTTEYAFGDEVLKHVGTLLRETVRETDYPARCGGDEFCVLLPQTSPAEAVQTAMRIRQRISGTTVQAKGYSMQVTVSIGIDSYDGRAPSSPELVKRNANKALQEAKRRGKNQVWLFAGNPAESAGEA